MADGVVNPWDSTDKHDTHPSYVPLITSHPLYADQDRQVAAFKYRHKTREGHMEDSLPTLNTDVRNVSSSLPVGYSRVRTEAD